jgi:hypothetical protein
MSSLSAEGGFGVKIQGLGLSAEDHALLVAAFSLPFVCVLKVVFDKCSLTPKSTFISHLNT